MAAAAARLEQCNRPVILIGCEFPDVHRDSSVSPNSCEFNPDHQLFSSAPWFTVSAAVCLLHCDSASVPVQRFSPDSNTFSNDALVPVPELLLMPWFGALRGPRGGVGRSDVSLGGELSDAAGRPSVPAVIRMHSSPTRLSLSLSLRGPLVVCSSPFCLPYSPHDECCPLLPLCLCPPPLLSPPPPAPLHNVPP